MHKNVCIIQNKNRKENQDELALSQRDMALTQVRFHINISGNISNY